MLIDIRKKLEELFRRMSFELGKVMKEMLVLLIKMIKLFFFDFYVWNV